MSKAYKELCLKSKGYENWEIHDRIGIGKKGD